MERRSLGPFEVSPVGVGTAPLGSTRDWVIWWGPQDEREAIGAVHRALELGVNWIDTAPFYGWGRAEEVVGTALAGRRDDVLLFTKCGTFRDGDNLRPESIRRDLEASLQRLRTDHVDLLQFHDPDPSTPIEESWGALHELVREGKARHGGLSNHTPELVERTLAVGPVAALQFQYSALARDHEQELLPYALQHELGVIVWSPLASGFLTDGFSLDALPADDFRRTHPFAELELDQTHAELRARGGGSVTRGALEFVLAHPAVTGAIVGIRNERE